MRITAINRVKIEFTEYFGLAGENPYSLEIIKVGRGAIVSDGCGMACLCCLTEKAAALIAQAAKVIGSEYFLWSSGYSSSYGSELLCRWPKGTMHSFEVVGHDKTGHQISTEEFLKNCQEAEGLGQVLKQT